MGIGLPSTGANLARRTTNPDLVLVYEAGAIGAKPPSLPLSIGDGMLGETADAIVGVPEMFNYWVQSGRIDVGFLGAAQIDRFANINTTAIGDYDNPKVRLPGAGGAPEIAASCGEVIVIVRQSKRAFVEKVDFITSVGHGDGPGARERLGLRGKGPTRVITDLGILEPDPETQRADAHPPAQRDHRRAGAGGDRLGPEDRARSEDDRTADRRRTEQAARAGGRMSDAYILDAIRTPFGRFGGGLAKVRPDDLGAHVVEALLSRSPDLDPAQIDDVAFGNANGAGEDNRNVGRMAVLLAGLPTSVPANTVNRLCGSSLDAAMLASPPDRDRRRRRRPRRRRGVDEPRAVGAAQARDAASRRATASCTRRRSAGAWSTRTCRRSGRSRSARAPRSSPASTRSPARRRTSSRSRATSAPTPPGRPASTTST